MQQLRNSTLILGMAFDDTKTISKFPNGACYRASTFDVLIMPTSIYPFHQALIRHGT